MVLHWNILSDMFTLVTDDSVHRHLRSAFCDDIVVPRTYTKTLSQRSCAVSRPVICNGPLTAIRNMDL